MVISSIKKFSSGHLKKLAALLAKFVDSEFQNIAKLDGFFAALHISTELIMPSDFLPLIIGEQGFPESFKTAKDVNEAISLLMHFWNDVGERFRQPPLVPHFDTIKDGEILGNEWVNGFLEGVAFSQGFDEIIQDKLGIELFAPIFLIAHEHEKNPELKISEKPVTKETRPKILAALVAAVNHMYQMNLEYRGISSNGNQTITHGTKMGRNDICSCGSGKKYKKCCL